MTYFTEREGDLPPATNDDMPDQFVEAIAAEVQGLCDRWWLARGWPVRCSDPGGMVIGTDQNRFWREARAKLNLSVGDISQLTNEPNRLRVLNLIEFVHEHVAAPIIAGWHDYFAHNHLNFDGPSGKAQFRESMNGLFARYGLAYNFTDAGVVIRRVPEAIGGRLTDARFRTGDAQLDELLEAARTKYLSPDPAVRLEGLEKLWDALERLKTVEDGKDKKARVTELIEGAYAEPDARTRIDNELNELTKIGNTYNIRHFEKDRLPLPDDAFVDYLFQRCYSSIYLLLDKTDRIRH